MQSSMLKKESSVKKYTPLNYRFLLNSNISAIVSRFLSEQLNSDFIHISDLSDEILTDSQIVKIAKETKRIIITHDLDYGEIYYLKEQGKIGVIMLRLDDQTSNCVISILLKFFKDKKYQKFDLAKTLTIISDKKVRFFSAKT